MKKITQFLSYSIYIVFLSLTRKSQLQRQIFTFIKYHTISSHNAFHTILERRLPRPAVVFNNQVCAILVVWFAGNTEKISFNL